MKNYDIENVKKELPVGKRVVLKSKKIAYLVPHVFERVRTGFYLKTRAFKENIIPEGAVSQAKLEATTAVDRYNAMKSENYEKQASNVTEQKASVENDSSIKPSEKEYLLFALNKEIEMLNNKSINVLKNPRPLRISTVFLKKLIVNTHKRHQEVKEIKNEFKKMDENDPILEYINLMNERNALMEKYGEPIGRIKNAEARLMELVKSGQVTQEKLAEYSNIAKEAAGRIRG